MNKDEIIAPILQAINDVREEVRDNKKEIREMREEVRDNKKEIREMREEIRDNKKEIREMREENNKRWAENDKKWEQYEINRKKDKEEYNKDRKQDKKDIMDALIMYDISISTQLKDPNVEKMKKVVKINS